MVRLVLVFSSHWLKKWRESFRPITKRSDRNHVITFDSDLNSQLPTPLPMSPSKKNLYFLSFVNLLLSLWSERPTISIVLPAMSPLLNSTNALETGLESVPMCH